MLVALVLMPFGMGGAAAVAAAPPAVAATAGCDDHHEPADSPAKAKLHCAACAALAAMEAPSPAADLRPELPRILETANSFSDTEPDTATPPPRSS